MNHLKSTTKPIKTSTNPVVRGLFFVFGLVFLFLGMVGISTPILPTTPFLIVAAGCFARSSKRFYDWLMAHKVFGKILRDWEERRAIPRYAKYLSFSMMSLSCAMLFWRLPKILWWIAILFSLLCIGVAIWMARLPDA